MRLRRLATVLIFFVLVFFYFHADPLVLENTNRNIHYRIEISDSFTLFYFQCPEITWLVEGTSSLMVNNQVYPTQGKTSFCDKQSNWQIAGGNLAINRSVLGETPWGLGLLAVFVWLLLGCFESPMPWDNLAVFSFMWALAYIMHLISYDYGRTTFAIGSVQTIFSILAAVLVLCHPKKILPLLLLASAQLLEYYVLSPYASNHTFSIAVINFVMLLAFGRVLILYRAINRAQFYQLFAPILRAMILILYFWAWFHKLNSSFINPAESCAVNFYELTRVNFPFFPTGAWVNYSIIYGSLLLEATLPIMLIIPRSRFIAMLIGVGFHGFLGLSNFRDFTFLMFVLYFTFISEAGLERAKDLMPKFLSYVPTWLKQTLWALLVMVFVITLPGIRESGFSIGAGLLANAVNVIFFGIVVVYWLYRQWFKQENNLTAPIFNPVSILFWIIVPLFFINGAMPFIGLKTDNSFDMYSNLHTEQGSNHFIFPAYGQIFDYPNDLVEIIESSDVNFNPSGAQLVFWTFRERFYDRQPEYVVYRRNGVELTVDAENAEDLLGMPAPLLLKKLMLFQEVSSHCRV